MPTAKPSEKTGHEGEWWRKDHADHGQENTDESAEDNAIAGKNKYEEEQSPTRHPV